MANDNQDATLGGRIKALRESRGWSQTRLGVEVSRALGSETVVAQARVSQWETNASSVSLEYIGALCEVFDVRHEELVPPRKRAESTEHEPLREVARREGVSEKTLRAAIEDAKRREAGAPVLPSEDQGASGIRASRSNPRGAAKRRLR